MNMHRHRGTSRAAFTVVLSAVLSAGAGVLLAALPVRAQPAPAPPGNGVCAEAVQGRIAWNYEGNKHWAQSNIERLCASAEDSAEPATCFNRAMHGGLDWGGGTRWQWENALNLCRGTRDANRTIQCFEREIATGIAWHDAIPTCRRSALVPLHHDLYHCEEGKGFDIDTRMCVPCPDGTHSDDGLIEVPFLDELVEATVCVPDDTPDTTCPDGQGFDTTALACRDCLEGFHSSDGAVTLPDGTAVEGTVCVPTPGEACVPRGLDPAADFDGDGLSNALEIALAGIGALSGQFDPCDGDTDGDGVPDGVDLAGDGAGLRARLSIKSFRQHDALDGRWAWMDDLGDGAWNLSGEIYVHGVSLLGTGGPVSPNISFAGFTRTDHFANVNRWSAGPGDTRGRSEWIDLVDDARRWTTGLGAHEPRFSKWGSLPAPSIVASLLLLDDDSGETVGRPDATLYFDTDIQVNPDEVSLSVTSYPTLDLVFALWGAPPVGRTPGLGQGTVGAVLTNEVDGSGRVTDKCTLVYAVNEREPTIEMCFDLEVRTGNGAPIDPCRLWLVRGVLGSASGVLGGAVPAACGR